MARITEYQCDRCGKKGSWNETLDEYSRGIIRLAFESDFYDLCSVCHKELKKWLKMK